MLVENNLAALWRQLDKAKPLMQAIESRYPARA